MRSAFNSILHRFSPDELQKRFDKQSRGGLVPGSKKARYWESYAEYYQDLIKDMDDSFQYLFGDEFVQAYEAQLQKLAHARRQSAASRNQTD